MGRCSDGRIDNSGVVSVPLGKAGFGAGEQAALDLSGDGFLQVTISSSPSAANSGALIRHLGRVTADGGRIEMKAATARDATRHAINLSGNHRGTRPLGQDPRLCRAHLERTRAAGCGVRTGVRNETCGHAGIRHLRWKRAGDICRRTRSSRHRLASAIARHLRGYSRDGPPCPRRADDFRSPDCGRNCHRRGPESDRADQGG